MKIIERKEYLDKLIKYKHNGFIKIITGLRRVGKSFILGELFINHLKSLAVSNLNIIYLSLEHINNKQYLKPKKLYDYLTSKIVNDDMHYFILDEIQLVKDFESVLISLMKFKNVDIYVTGSNSKFLSNDIKTQFRGRGVDIHIYPLTYQEIYDYYNQHIDEYNELKDKTNQIDKSKVYEWYVLYGGLPNVALANNVLEKQQLLANLYENIYINDILERYQIRNQFLLSTLLKILSANIGNLFSTNKIFNLIKANKINLNYETLERYLKILQEAFLIYKVDRLDYKNSKIIEGSCKYYFSDLGIRNYLLNFLKIDRGLLLENLLANYLKYQQANICVGIINKQEKNDATNKQLTKYNTYEIDFIVELKNNRYLIQCSYDVSQEQTYNRETKVFNYTKDHFRKLLVTLINVYDGLDDKGINHLNIINLLLNLNLINQ